MCRCGDERDLSVDTPEKPRPPGLFWLIVGEDFDQRDFSLSRLQGFLLCRMRLPAVEVDEFQREGKAVVVAREEGAVAILHALPLAGGKQALVAQRMVVVAGVAVEIAGHAGEIREGEGDDVPIYYRHRQFEALEEGSAFLHVGERGDAALKVQPCRMEGLAELVKALRPQCGGEEEAVGLQMVEGLVECGDRVVQRGKGEVGQQQRVGGLAVGRGLRMGEEGLGGAAIAADVEGGWEGAFGVGQMVDHALGAFCEEGGASGGL